MELRPADYGVDKGKFYDGTDSDEATDDFDNTGVDDEMDNMKMLLGSKYENDYVEYCFFAH